MGLGFTSKFSTKGRWADGRMYEGHWFNGKQHGEGFYTNKDKVRKKGYWEEGNRIKWVDQ